MSTTADFPFADTPAARILSSALEQMKARTGKSLRQVGKELGYRQAVVLSHMASGRVPIPIDRVPSLAAGLAVDEQAFLRAVLRQRHPNVEWAAPPDDQSASSSTSFLMAKELTAGRHINELNPGQRAVIREAAADGQAERRWLTVHEVAAIELLRSLRPSLKRDGLGSADQQALKRALETAGSLT